MKNDYIDYLIHDVSATPTARHKYIAKVKTSYGMRYFYSQKDYQAFLTKSNKDGTSKDIESTDITEYNSLGELTEHIYNNRKTGVNRSDFYGKDEKNNKIKTSMSFSKTSDPNVTHVLAIGYDLINNKYVKTGTFNANATALNYIDSKQEGKVNKDYDNLKTNKS